MKTEEIGVGRAPALAQVPEPRAARGRRRPPTAILALAVAAMLADARSFSAVAHWGRLQSAETMRAGIHPHQDAKTPGVSTLHEVFKALDVAAFEAALAAWAQAALALSSRAIALDGKALRGIHRGRLARGALGGGVRCGDRPRAGATGVRTCAPSAIARYQKRISGPPLDRLDIGCRGATREVRKADRQRRGGVLGAGATSLDRREQAQPRAVARSTQHTPTATDRYTSATFSSNA